MLSYRACIYCFGGNRRNWAKTAQFPRLWRGDSFKKYLIDVIMKMEHPLDQSILGGKPPTFVQGPTAKMQ